jgi:cell shape-determining protein MreC
MTKKFQSLKEKMEKLQNSLNSLIHFENQNMLLEDKMIHTKSYLKTD